MPIRIGGTTQDRATYDPNLEAYVSYSVDDPLEAPMTLTYGPKFFDLIRESCNGCRVRIWSWGMLTSCRGYSHSRNRNHARYVLRILGSAVPFHDIY